jgi:ABC-type uncharacterized transport system substrate-binding protein
MKRRHLSTILLVVVLTFAFSLPAFAKTFPTTPRGKGKGKKFRIIYLQGGPYFEYDTVFRAVIGQLRRLGWMEKIHIPAADAATARSLYTYLAKNPNWSRYLEFVEDGFYDGDWKDELRLHNKQEILRRNDYDMVFALGTWAGQDMKTMPPEMQIPAVVMDVSDSLGAKIVNSNEDSGRNNLTARVDPLRYQRQLRMFHDIIGFQKLGMAYEDTVEGKSYAAVSDVEAIAGEREFTITRKTHVGYFKSKESAEKWLLDSVRQMAPQIDAFYLTQQLGLHSESLPKVLNILNQHGIPTFSQTGSAEVKDGVLLSIATSGFKYVAEYHAKKIARILNGAKPRELPILFEDPAKIAINLRTAQEIGFDPPVDILGAADEIFTE